MAPMKVTKASAVGEYSKSGEQRATMNTPAVTMVAAWIRAETGVGPSIASGSQVCSGELRRLAHGADEQQEADHGERIEAATEHLELVSANCGAWPNTTSNSTESNTR